MQRRNLLLGLGSATAASALLGSGAVTELTMDRGINVKVAQDSDGLLTLAPIDNSTNSSKYLSGVDSQGALIDIGRTDLAEGINYDSEAYYDNVLELQNSAANELAVSMPIENDAEDGTVNDNRIERDNGFSVDLYEGERATSGEIELLDQNSPLNLSSSEAVNLGVRVQVPERNQIGKFSNDGDDRQNIQADLSITAESRETSPSKVGNDAVLSYQSDPAITDTNNPSEVLDLGFTFDTVSEEKATKVFVQFDGDALETGGKSDVAGFMDGDSINVGNSLDVNDVVVGPNGRADDDSPENTDATGPTSTSTADFAEIEIDMSDDVVSQTDARDVALNNFKVQLEDEDASQGAEVKVILADSSGTPFAETPFQPLTD